MIPTDRLDRLTIEVTTGQIPTPQDAEEREYVERVAAEIAEIEDQNLIVDIPAEWQV